MDVVHPEFVPDASLSREDMETLQRDLAAKARFEDDVDFEPADVAISEPVTGSQQTLNGSDAPVVAGVDQAFVGDLAVSAIVVLRDGAVIERAWAVADAEVPYIPGLLSFREGNAILAAFDELTVAPDLAVVDGSGRIHFREAGIATHIGVMLDLPAIGVAKSLLCGRPTMSLDEPLPEGERVPIEANGRVETESGTVIGYAYQSRQYDSGNRHINPLYVSPGHRVSAATATDFVAALCAGYKLPEPTRLADGYADDVKDLVEGHD